MDMSFESRPRLIDRLRLFQLFRRHFGEEDAEAVVDALQDEFSPVATMGDMTQLYLKIQAEMHALRAEIHAMSTKMITAMGIIAGIALAIARLT